jgi:hypothetical protein
MKKLKNVNGLSLTKDTLKLLASQELRDGLRQVAGGAVSNRYHSGVICC